MAMISTLHSVWLRPAVLGGFGGMSDRFLHFHLFVLPFGAGGGRRSILRMLGGEILGMAVSSGIMLSEARGYFDSVAPLPCLAHGFAKDVDF